MAYILVTGAAGFIGSHLCANFLKKGFGVIGIDHLKDYYSADLKKFNLFLLKTHKRFKFIESDILDQSKNTRIFKSYKISFLIHCAARVGVRASVADPLAYTQTNVLGTQNLLEIVRLQNPGVKSILLSSSSVYGIQKKPCFDEKMTPNPQSPYGASKLAMELIAKQYHAFYGLPIVVVRPFSIFGPRGRVDMAPLLMIRAIERGEPFIRFGTDKNNRRDWTYIDDFVRGIEGLLMGDQFSEFEIFNLGSNHSIGIEEFTVTSALLAKKYLKKDVMIINGQRGRVELPVTRANLVKAKKVLGYQPRVAFAEGMEILFKFYLSNRCLYAKIFGL